MVAHGDDEGKAEFRDIGIVEGGELRPLRVGQRVQTGAGLFRRAFLRQTFCGGQLARQIGVSGQNAKTLLRRRGAKDAGQCIVQSDRAVMRGAKLQIVGAFGDPGGMLENTAIARDEGAPVHLAGTLAPDMGVLAHPVLGDVDAACEPHIIEAAGIFDEPFESHYPPRTPDQTAVQPDGHHAPALRAQAVETVLEV